MHGSGAHLVGSSPAHTGCLQGRMAVKSSLPHHSSDMGLARIDKTFKESQELTNSTCNSARTARFIRADYCKVSANCPLCELCNHT